MSKLFLELQYLLKKKLEANLTLCRKKMIQKFIQTLKTKQKHSMGLRKIILPEKISQLRITGTVEYSKKQ